MRRRMAALALIAVSSVFALGGTASAGSATLVAYMFGANERPGPGDPDGVGRAVVIIDDDTNTICIYTQFANLDPVTGYHIHVAPPTAPGPVVVPFRPPTSQQSSECRVVEDEALLDNIAANPQQYYVNLHTGPFGPGAIRGQLQAAGGSGVG